MLHPFFQLCYQGNCLNHSSLGPMLFRTCDGELVPIHLLFNFWLWGTSSSFLCSFQSTWLCCLDFVTSIPASNSRCLLFWVSTTQCGGSAHRWVPEWLSQKADVRAQGAQPVLDWPRTLPTGLVVELAKPLPVAAAFPGSAYCGIVNSQLYQLCFILLNLAYVLTKMIFFLSLTYGQNSWFDLLSLCFFGGGAWREWGSELRISNILLPLPQHP